MSAAGRRRCCTRSARSGSRTISTAPSLGWSPPPARSSRRSRWGTTRARSGRRRARSGSRTSSDDSISRDRPGDGRGRADPSRSAARPRPSTAEGDGLWLAVGASDTEHRGGTLTVSSQRHDADLDRSRARLRLRTLWQVLTITNDGLLAYQKVGGADGAALVPDLASALPQVSPDGLTYRFPLRGGIRYSTGDPSAPRTSGTAWNEVLLLAATQRRSSARSTAPTRVPRTPPTCDLRESIVTDAEAVTFHLARPDPDLPLQAHAAVRVPGPGRRSRPRTRGSFPSRRRDRTWS